MKEISNQAAAAKAIRQELKKAFPTIKFSVTSESFAGGDSVDIRWTDGPTSDAVDAITRKYQYGHFDGMIDLYEISNNRDDIPQSKYVMCQRTLSDMARLHAKNEIINKFGLDSFEDKIIMEKFGCWPDTLIYRELQDKDLTLSMVSSSILA